MSDVAADSAETVRLLEQVGQGDSQALDALLARYRPRLHAFVRVRLDPRVRSRLDASDVVQEAQLRIAGRMGEFLERRPMPFHLWARKVAYERLLNAQRGHRAAARRSVDREVALPDRSSLLLALTFIVNAVTSAHGILHASRSSAGRLATAARSRMPARSASFCQCWNVWRMRAYCVASSASLVQAARSARS
jgi:RNA polymerase sigma factor (sigma-70 family)